MKIEKLIMACEDMTEVLTLDPKIDADDKSQMRLDLVEAAKLLKSSDMPRLKESTASVLEKLWVELPKAEKKESKKESKKGEKESKKESKKGEKESKKGEKESKIGVVQERANSFVSHLKHTEKKGIDQKELLSKMVEDCQRGERNVRYSLENFLLVSLAFKIISQDEDGRIYLCR